MVTYARSSIFLRFRPTDTVQSCYTFAMPIPTAVFIVFLVLKLIGTITWSWWWVTAPLWIPAALFVALWMIGLTLVKIASSGKEKPKW